MFNVRTPKRLTEANKVYARILTCTRRQTHTCSLVHTSVTKYSRRKSS